MRRLLAATAVAALALLSAGCGDDDDSTLPGKTPSAATTEDAAEEPAADSIDTVAGGSDDTDAPDTEADVPDAGELGAKCAELAARFGGSFGEDSDFGAVADAIDEMKSFTPDSIDADLDTVGAAFERIAELIDSKGGPATAFSDPAVLAEFQKLDTPEFQAANDRLTAFFDEACPELSS